MGSSISSGIKDITGVPQEGTKGQLTISKSTDPQAELDAQQEQRINEEEAIAARAKQISDMQTKQTNVDQMNSIRRSLSINKTLG